MYTVDPHVHGLIHTCDSAPQPLVVHHISCVSFNALVCESESVCGVSEDIYSL